MTEITDKEIITLSEVKHLLESGKPEEMDQIQRWTLDYVSKFSKVSHDEGKKLVDTLVNECDLTEEEACGGRKYPTNYFRRAQNIYLRMEKADFDFNIRKGTRETKTST